jgi:hypothetical protein
MDIGENGDHVGHPQVEGSLWFEAGAFAISQIRNVANRHDDLKSQI